MNDPRTTWVPYMMNTRDCSQGFCSLYCPQWCYIIFPPPPPPPPFDFPADSSSTTFSPLVIAIIGILASAFLLVSYYAIMSKYCRKTGQNRGDHHQEFDSEGIDHDPSSTSSVHRNDNSNNGNSNSNGVGLGEDQIRLIASFKYEKQGKKINISDCSVCLSEFKEDETLRILPKCSHCFHLPCIDTWLRSHPNCPLCRSNVVSDNQQQRSEAFVLEDQPQQQQQEQSAGDSNGSGSGSVSIVIRDDENVETNRRRSVSLDLGRLSIADILRIDHDEDDDDVGIRSSKQSNCRGNRQQQQEQEQEQSNGVMNRSFSSGRFLFPKRNRGSDSSILPS